MKLWGVMDNVMYGDILLVYWGCLLIVLPLALLWIERSQPCENRRVSTPGNKCLHLFACVSVSWSLSLCASLRLYALSVKDLIARSRFVRCELPLGLRRLEPP